MIIAAAASFPVVTAAVTAAIAAISKPYPLVTNTIEKDTQSLVRCPPPSDVLAIACLPRLAAIFFQFFSIFFFFKC